MIKLGMVEVNGEKVYEPWMETDPAVDIVYVDGQPVRRDEKVYILLNKPSGYLSTVSDSRGRPTVVDLIGGISERLYPVGRLDYDSEGLLLMTNDGELANRLMHPRYGVDKTYQVEVKGIPDKAKITALEKGVMLEDGLTSPAQVRMLKQIGSGSELEITIHEGRKRQVKKMFAFVGHPVIKLVRVKYAFLNLGQTRPGEWRKLKTDEVERLYQISAPKE